MGHVVCVFAGGPVLRADSNNCCGIMLTIMSWLLILFTLPFSLGVCLRVRLHCTCAVSHSACDADAHSSRLHRQFVL